MSMRRIAWFTVVGLLSTIANGGTIYTDKGGSGTITRGYQATGGSVELEFLTSASSAPACVSTFFNDTFTEAEIGNINLGDHSPEEGDLWIGANASDGTIVLDRSADELKSTNTGSLSLRAFSNLTADCSNYSVFANAKIGTTGSSHRVGVVGRWLNTSSGNGYGAWIGGDATWHLEKRINGTTTELATGSIAGFAGSTYYDIELRMSGTTISMYINTALKGSVTDATHSVSGTNGIFLRNGYVRMTSTSAVYP